VQVSGETAGNTEAIFRLALVEMLSFH
jgi:hypothetical protein